MFCGERPRKIKNKTNMSVLTISISYCTVCLGLMAKGYKNTFEGDECVLYFDCGMVHGLYTGQNSSDYTLKVGTVYCM